MMPNMIAEGFLAEDPVNNRGTTATIFTGYGVGMGLIIDGKVYLGATGGASRIRAHEPHSPWRTLPLRPARLH